MSESPARGAAWLRDLQRRASPEVRRAEDTQRFEDGRIRWLLQRLKLGRMIPRLASEQEAATGLRFLSCSCFNGQFPTFPFHLGTSTLRGLAVPWGSKRTADDYLVYRDPYSVEPARFRKFAWVPFVIAYQQLYDQAASAAAVRRIALIFPRKGLRQGMVIHNDESEQFWSQGLCWVFKAPRGGRRLYVQPLDALVDGLLAAGWQP